MKIEEVEIEGKVNELLAVLDKDIQHLQQSVSCLNELRSLTIKHDDSALSKLLERIQSESGSYRNHELKRQSIRRELAVALGCDLKEMTLSMLGDNLPEEQKARVTTTKTKLNELVKELRKEYISTSFLLSECARFNKVLLKSVFGLRESGVVTYTNNGAAKQQTNTMFVNMRF